MVKRTLTVNQTTCAAVLIAGLTSLFVGSRIGLAHCGTPCFQNNEDILSGQRHLLRNDDLVYLDPILSLIGRIVGFDSRIFQSSMLNLAEPTDLQALSLSVTPVPLLEVGRMFAPPNDVIVNVTLCADSQRAIDLTDPQEINKDGLDRADI